MNQSQITRYVSIFESLFYVPAFTQKNFHHTSTQDFPHREPPLRIWQIQIRITQLLSPTKQPLYKRQGTTTITSHKRDKALSQTNHNHLYTRGITTNPNHNLNHLYTRGMNTNPKQRKITTLGDLKDHKQS